MRPVLSFLILALVAGVASAEEKPFPGSDSVLRTVTDEAGGTGSTYVGSGVVVAKMADGWYLGATASHGLQGGKTRTTVQPVKSNGIYDVTFHFVVDRLKCDIALFSFHAPNEDLEIAPIRASDLALGDRVNFVGYGGRGHGATCTTGTITATHRDNGQGVPVHEGSYGGSTLGNSGGPVLDVDGGLAGIHWGGDGGGHYTPASTLLAFMVKYDVAKSVKLTGG